MKKNKIKYVVRTFLILGLLLPVHLYAYDPKAKQVTIDDNGSYYSSSNVETALQEIGAKPSFSILSSDISNWNSAYGWGNHALVGYLTVESDPLWEAAKSEYFKKDTDTLDNILEGSTNKHLTATLKSNYDEAYSWGNHALAGYLTSESDPVVAAINGIVKSNGTTISAATLGEDYTKPYERAFTNSDLSGGILTVNHQLGKKYNIVQVYNNSNKQITPDDITLTDTNNLSIDISSWGTISGTWHVVVITGVN